MVGGEFCSVRYFEPAVYARKQWADDRRLKRSSMLTKQRFNSPVPSRDPATQQLRAPVIAGSYGVIYAGWSGRLIHTPEVERGAWFSLTLAEVYILKSQQPLLETLRSLLAEVGADHAF